MSGLAADLDQKYFSRRGRIGLWLGVLLAPISWAFHLLTSYLIASTHCGSGWKLFLLAYSAAFLGLAFAGGWHSWTNYRDIGNKWSKDSNDGIRVRTRFIAGAGLVLGCLSFLLILAQTIPMLLLDICK